MLKELRIFNLILVVSAEIPFEKGLNVLSGETGAGKSAILQALALLIGEKANPGAIRHGSNKAVIEGLFEIDQDSLVKELLNKAGIDHGDEDDLIVKREISSSGKGRCWINNQPVQIAFLKKIGTLLVEMVDQHANQRLLSLDQHRRILDLFGGLEEDVSLFAKSWEAEQTLKKRIEEAIRNEAQRLRDIEVCRLELEELYEGNVKEGEDEELFSEYSLLINGEEIAQKVEEISQVLTGEKVSAISLLNRTLHSFEKLATLDTSLTESLNAYRNAIIELQEVAHTLRLTHSRAEHNPERLTILNDRLTLISKLKRKYGSTISEIQLYQQQTEERLQLLENADLQIEEWKEELSRLESRNKELAHEITLNRRKIAEKFAESLTEQLRSLNMSKAQFEVGMTSQFRTRHGDDKVEFFLIPNVGEKRISIRDCASGGELSRILLGIQTLLAGKESVPTLIFDEIDANIGGETAVVIGEKLRAIGAQHQLLCITHFPQVARQAHHHIQIEKQELQGRTISFVTVLDSLGKERELERMLGKRKAVDEICSVG
jgi:DNA repair protein RecN (Recombination protein N)